MSEQEPKVVHHHYMPNQDGCVFGGCWMFAAVTVVCYTIIQLAKLGQL